MEKNIFWLENDQLKEIASSFREKVEEGLKHENAGETMHTDFYLSQNL